MRCCSTASARPGGRAHPPPPPSPPPPHHRGRGGKGVAMVDEQREAQYMYPEFLLAQRMFERAGIAAYIADPAALHARGDGLYLDGRKIDLVYNRLTDFP